MLRKIARALVPLEGTHPEDFHGRQSRYDGRSLSQKLLTSFPTIMKFVSSTVG